MTDHDDELIRKMCDLHVPPLGLSEIWNASTYDRRASMTDLNISPYGLFTPISVRSYSLSADADLE